MTIFGATIRRLAARTFRDRQIIIRTESGVVARTISRGQQMLAVGLGFAIAVWIVASSVALVAAGNGLLQREARLAALDEDRARLAAQLASRETELAEVTARDRDAAAVLADLNRQFGVLERARRQDQASLAALAAERDRLERRLGDHRDALADTQTERERLRARLADRQADLARLNRDRDEMDRRIAGLRDSLIEARSWNASLRGAFARLGSTIYESSRLVFAGDEPSGLVLALDAAEQRVAELESQRAALAAGAARLWAERNRLRDGHGRTQAALARTEAGLAEAQAEVRALRAQADRLLRRSAALWQERNIALDAQDRARAARDRAHIALAEARQAQDAIAARLDASLRHAVALWTERNRLADELGGALARADAADADRQAAESRMAELQAQLIQASRHAHDLWARGNALTDLVDTLTAELQRNRIETAELRVAQQQFFSEVRTRAEAHIDAVEEGLAFTGLDIDSLISTMHESGGVGLGGPMIPALTGRPLNAAMWAEASDIVVLIDRAAALRDIANGLPIGMPVEEDYRLSSGFGTRTDPFTGRVARHHGLDFAAGHGTPILATAPGRVVRAGWRGAYGYLVEVEHDFGLTTRYAHLSAVLVEEGDEVDYGDEVGLMGSTGRSSGPHLHYEVRVGGDPRNPIRYIRAGQNVFQAAN